MTSLLMIVRNPSTTNTDARHVIRKLNSGAQKTTTDGPALKARTHNSAELAKLERGLRRIAEMEIGEDRRKLIQHPADSGEEHAHV